MEGSWLEDYVVFESDQDWGRQLLAFTQGKTKKLQGNCKKLGHVIPLWSVKNPASGLRFFDFYSSKPVSKFLGEPDDIIELPFNDPIAELRMKNLTTLLKPSGVIVTGECKYSHEGYVFAESTVQAIAIGPDQEGKGHTLMVWVTTMATGESVSNAEVILYGRGFSEGHYKPLGRATTNANGIADFKDAKKEREMHVVIVIGKKKFIYIPNVLLGSVVKSDVQESIVLDRKLVRPEESLNVLGYVRQRTGKEYIPVDNLTDTRLVIKPTLGMKEGYPVKVDKTFGSYQATIEIPRDAEITRYRIGFRALRPNGKKFSGRMEAFSIGLPRLPTVDLTVDAPFWIRPDGVIEIVATVESFIGSAVGGQEIDVTYSVDDPEKDDEAETGELTILTNDTGVAIGMIDLSKLASKPSIQSTVDIKLQYVGPTGELIEKSATVDVDVANVNLDLSLTVDNPLPQLPFGVKLTATNLRGNPVSANGSIDSATVSLIGVPDDTNTYDVPEKTTEKIDGNITSVCDVIIGKSSLLINQTTQHAALGSDDYCNLTLPSTGKFAIEGCVKQADITVCTQKIVGRSQEEWDKDPLDHFFPIGFTDLTPQKLNLGDKKQILVENPYQGTKMLIAWGSVLDIKTQIRELHSGRSIVEVEVDQLCEYGCGMIIAVVIPRQTTGVAVDPPVPVSKLFDPARPHTEKFEEDILVKSSRPTKVDVSISFPGTVKDDGVAVVGPSDNATVRVEVDANQRTEVSIIAVDKAILELVPNSLADISKDFLVELQASFEHISMSRFIVSPQAIQGLIEHFNKRKAMNPWFSPVTTLDDSYDIDRTDEEYMDNYSRYLTIQSSGYRSSTFKTTKSQETAGIEEESEGGAPAPAPLAAEAPASAESSGSSGSSGFRLTSSRRKLAATRTTAVMSAEMVPLRSEADFETTFLFKTEVTKDGKLATTFTAPVNLGTFIFRAYAVTKDGLFGSSESELIVRRELSLTPSAPAFVRVGDSFEAGAVVTVTGSTNATVSLKAEVDGPLKLNGDDVLSVDVGADGQEEARFTLSALAVGSGNLTLTASDREGSGDALQLQIDVEGPQEPVTVGTSFVVQGTDDRSFVEGIDLPDAIPGSGGILTTAGVGRQPSVLAIADTVLRIKDPFVCPVDADFALAAVSIPGIIDPYDLWNVGNGTLGEELSSLIDLMLSHFKQAAELLGHRGGLTTKKLGLRSYLPCPETQFPIEPAPSFYQNGRGVFLMKFVLPSLRNHTLESIRSSVKDLNEAYEMWMNKVSKELEGMAKRSRKQFKKPLDASYVAFGRACLGADWTPKATEGQIMSDLSMRRLSREFDKLSIENQAYYVLARQEKGDHPDITKAIDSWISLLRITGRTAYISAFTGATAPASDLANTLVFLAMIRAGTDDQLIPKLASYVANPLTDEYGFRFFDTYSQVLAMQALVEFDVSRGSASPDLEFEAVSGNVTLLSATFRNSTTPVASSLVPWESLPNEPKPIVVSAVGQGEASVSISLMFVPSMLLPFPTYRGIFVERSFQLESSMDGDGKGISAIPQGEVISVKVQFMTPDALGETVVRVQMPAGLEPVDPDVLGICPPCPVPFFSLFKSFNIECPIQQTKPDVVTFTYESVSAGSTSVSFRAVAATVGTFALPPTRVFAVDQPEVMGLSSAGSFEVCSGSTCAVTFLEPSKVPKSCKSDCSGSGVCNTVEGTCICFEGFTGEACEILKET